MSTPNPTHIDIIARGLALASDDACFDREPDDDSPSDAEDREYWMKLARASVSKLTDAGYSIVQLPESHPPSDLFQDWWTDDGGWTVERHRGSPQIRLTFDEDDAMETSPDGEFYPFARLTANEAHDLGVALLASAAAAEGEKP